MPGKALAYMLLGHAILVGALALILISLEGHMIAQWGRGQSSTEAPVASPAP